MTPAECVLAVVRSALAWPVAIVIVVAILARTVTSALSDEDEEP
jgi:hypothetical protein